MDEIPKLFTSFSLPVDNFFGYPNLQDSREEGNILWRECELGPNMWCSDRKALAMRLKSEKTMSAMAGFS
jgi:hypothetical protein